MCQFSLIWRLSLGLMDLFLRWCITMPGKFALVVHRRHLFFAWGTPFGFLGVPLDMADGFP